MTTELVVLRTPALAGPLSQRLLRHLHPFADLWSGQPAVFGECHPRSLLFEIPSVLSGSRSVVPVLRNSCKNDGMSKISVSDLVEGHAARVGRQIKVLRGGRSGQWLADRTSALGYGVARTTISELENGKRSFVTTGELTALAVALSVPPVALLFPLGWGDVEASQETNIESLQWFMGDYVPAVTASVERETGVECDKWLYEMTTSDVRRTRERNGLAAKQDGLRDRLMKLAREGAEGDEIARVVDELNEVSRQIGRNGG